MLSGQKHIKHNQTSAAEEALISRQENKEYQQIRLRWNDFPLPYLRDAASVYFEYLPSKE
jgi:hypothetical protein